MKIAFVGNTGWCIYNYRLNLVRRMQESGAETMVFTPEDDFSHRLEQEGIPVTALSMQPKSVNPFREAISLVDLYRKLKAFEPDYVCSFTVKCNVYVAICSQLLGIKQIANISGLGKAFNGKGVLNSVVENLYRHTLGKANRILFQNEEDLKFCVEANLVPQEACKRIPGSGVDLRRFTVANGSTESEEAEKLLYLKRDRRVFLMYGRFVPRKGFSEFVEAANQLRAKYGEQVEFWVIGIDDFGTLESQQLGQSVRAAHEEGTVRLFPPTDDILPYIRAADVVVLPSWYHEGVPRSLLEALACGKPLVTTDWKGCKDTVAHGRNGMLVQPGDTKSLAAAMESLYNLPIEQLRGMGMESRQKAETEFDEEMVIDRYMQETQVAKVANY